jgi:3-methyl-2-oxobutanoate hydroxymethyltransferase
VPRFVKQYAQLREALGGAAHAFAQDVVGGAYPAAEHSFR